MSQAIKAVVFDIGNVFVRWDPRFLYEKLIDNADELDHFLSHVVTLEWHSEHDRGRSFAENITERCNQFPEYADLIAVFDTRWEEMFGGLIPGVIRNLETLVEGGIRCYGLTNFPAEKWPDFRLRFPFTDLLAGVIVSGQERLIKPDPRIFQLMLSRYNLDAETTLFIDDREANVGSARALGFRTHQFISPARLKRRLLELGLIT